MSVARVGNPEPAKGVAIPMTDQPADPTDLAAMAAAIVVPADPPWSARAHVYVAEVWVGDAWRWAVVFGPAFTDHATASALVRLLNDASERDAAHGEREPAAPRCCAVCDTPLPLDSRAHRQTCSETCRQQLARSRRQLPRAGAAERVPTAPGAAGVPRDGPTGHVGVSLATPTESVTARPTAPAVQLDAISPILNTEMDPAAVATPAGSEPEVCDAHTAPTC
jgi:hypothetical protein